MRKLLSLILALALMLTAAPIFAQAEEVTLTMGSWRNDDVADVEALLAVYYGQTGVKITYEPTLSAQYNSTLRLQLDSGTGPDLFYCRSYATGRELYEAGFTANCSALAGITDNFSPTNLEPWTADDGTIFAVPFAAVSQIVYYNIDIFEANALTVPETYEDFLALCGKLLDLGITPLANGIASEWDILECVFLAMIPSYIGGAEGRAAYESGEKKLNDETWVEMYTDFQKLAPYLPEGFSSIGNEDSGVLFGLGETAMFIEGSWSCSTFDEYGCNWGVFALPAPEGKETAICFHPDMAIAGNAASAHPDEVMAFLTWLASPEGAQTTSAYLPKGFFPLISSPIEIPDARVGAILKLNEGKVTDARFVWPKLIDLYNPILEQLNALLRGETTPTEAADSVYNQAVALGLVQ